MTLNDATSRFHFMTAGRAVFTLTSRRTGTSYTYRVTRPGTTWFVSVLTGPDNTSDYTYMGILDCRQPERPQLRCTKASAVREDAPSFRALEWFLQHLDSDQVEFRHCGRCARCGRQLTVPSSIDSGFGPECASKL